MPHSLNEMEQTIPEAAGYARSGHNCHTEMTRGPLRGMGTRLGWRALHGLPASESRLAAPLFADNAGKYEEAGLVGRQHSQEKLHHRDIIGIG